nr:putative phage tail protein [Escherichia coli]
MSLFSKNDYAGALGALLPTGRAWPRSQRTVQAAVLRALGSAFQRSDNDAQSLITGAFPPTATVMLSEWESSLGLTGAVWIMAAVYCLLRTMSLNPTAITLIAHGG